MRARRCSSGTVLFAQWVRSSMKEAVRETISFLTQTRDLSLEDAYSLASIGVEFEVSQVVDINKGIHGCIPKHLFPDGRSC